MFVVILGASVEEGLTLVGPFQSEDEALAYAEGTGEPYRVKAMHGHQRRGGRDAPRNGTGRSGNGEQ